MNRTHAFGPSTIEARGVREGEGRVPAYERPRIVFDEPLESFATVCSPPAKSNPVTCASGPISS